MKAFIRPLIFSLRRGLRREGLSKLTQNLNPKTHFLGIILKTSVTEHLLVVAWNSYHHRKLSSSGLNRSRYNYLQNSFLIKSNKYVRFHSFKKDVTGILIARKPKNLR